MSPYRNLELEILRLLSIQPSSYNEIAPDLIERGYSRNAIKDTLIKLMRDEVTFIPAAFYQSSREDETKVYRIHPVAEKLITYLNII